MKQNILYTDYRKVLDEIEWAKRERELINKIGNATWMKQKNQNIEFIFFHNKRKSINIPIPDCLKSKNKKGDEITSMEYLGNSTYKVEPQKKKKNNISNRNYFKIIYSGMTN